MVPFYDLEEDEARRRDVFDLSAGDEKMLAADLVVFDGAVFCQINRVRDL